MIAAVVNEREVIDHCDQDSRCICSAPAARIAAHVAVIEYCITVFEVLAGYPEPMTHGMQ
jgi:hypothetical protein